jgi:hypothetical protein
MTAAHKHERKLVLSFILPERQNRYLELLEKPKRRRDIASSLSHFKHLDMRYVIKLAPSDQHTSNILRLLTMKGAPKMCSALSEDSDLDGKELPLADALSEVIGAGIGTFLSCIPGKLAYFEDEEDRWILEHR